MYIILEQIWLKIALQVVAKFQEDLANAHMIEWWVTLCLSCSPLWGFACFGPPLLVVCKLTDFVLALCLLLLIGFGLSMVGEGH